MFHNASFESITLDNLYGLIIPPIIYISLCNLVSKISTPTLGPNYFFLRKIHNILMTIISGSFVTYCLHVNGIIYSTHVDQLI